MLIKALCDYSALQENKTPAGYCEYDIHYEILLTPEGKIAAINDVRIPQIIKLKNGKTKINYFPAMEQFPVRTEKTDIDKNTIEHRSRYIFGLNYDKGTLTPTDATNKAAKSHKCFCEWNEKFFENIDSPICKAYLNFIRTWEPEQETQNPHLLALGKEYSNSHFEFGLDGSPETKLHNDSKFKAAYEDYLAQLNADSNSDDTELSTCSILGEKLPQARIHKKIKGIKGGKSSGGTLVGMNDTAFESYGKKQSYNSNVSEKAMKMYTSALNSLLADRSHYKTFDDMTIVYFAMKKNDAEECNMFAGMFSGFEDELNKTVVTEADRNINTVMTQLKQGRTADMPYDPNVEFYVAGFTPNSSRISQKFIFHDKFGKIFDNVLKHQQDIAFTEGQRQVSIERIKRELISPKSSKEKVPSPLTAALFEAILKGTRYPDELLSTVITRVKTDSNEDNNHFIKINDVRAGLIRGCINRKYNKEVIKMTLDLNDKNSAKLCGRLFAVLEKIQQDTSEGTLNKTIVDTYFSSACSRPVTVFPHLVDLSFKHLKKYKSIELRNHYKDLTLGIIADLEEKFPHTLSNDEQGMFIVGYAQQYRDLYTKKSKDKPEENSEVKPEAKSEE
jgi:CRISPR-associated protein Csd1